MGLDDVRFHALSVLIAAALSACGGSGSDPGMSGAGGAGPSISFGEERSGEGTYYTFADGSGACSFDPSPNDLMIAALNFPDWSTSAWCGACADVQGPSGSVRIRIVDQCPECQSGDLDFSPQAFAALADPSLGRVPITWKFVACDVTGPVRYRYKDGANQWWTAVQIQNSRLPVTKLEWSVDGASWNPTVKTDYNYFLDDQGFGPDPVKVRITAVDGQSLTDDLPVVQELLVVAGASQFQ